MHYATFLLYLPFNTFGRILCGFISDDCAPRESPADVARRNIHTICGICARLYIQNCRLDFTTRPQIILQEWSSRVFPPIKIAKRGETRSTPATAIAIAMSYIGCNMLRHALFHVGEFVGQILQTFSGFAPHSVENLSSFAP